MKFFQENFLHAKKKKKGMIIQNLDYTLSTLHFQCVAIFFF